MDYKHQLNLSVDTLLCPDNNNSNGGSFKTENDQKILSENSSYAVSDFDVIVNEECARGTNNGSVINTKMSSKNCKIASEEGSPKRFKSFPTVLKKYQLQNDGYFYQGIPQANVSISDNKCFILPSTSSNTSFKASEITPPDDSQNHLQHSILNKIPALSSNLFYTNERSSSSASSEVSNSSQQINGWSFEEQYKQVRQLYEINDDPRRKEFLDELFAFMQKRGTPINRLPIMAKSVLDLYELYILVIARGGLVDVINKKLWQEIIKGLHLPSSITSAAFTLRTQYMKYLYPYECEKKKLSSPTELQAAIDGNRREGRRSSYGQIEAINNQLKLSRTTSSNHMQQISPLALANHVDQDDAVVTFNQHPFMSPMLGQIPNNVTNEFEQRMIEYLKLLQTHQESQGSQSPQETINALELSRVALWSMYHNNTSPPPSANSSPKVKEQQQEALNLSDTALNISIKRERVKSTSEKEDVNQHSPSKKNYKICQIKSNSHLTRAPLEETGEANKISLSVNSVVNPNKSSNCYVKNIELTPISTPLKDLNNSFDENIFLKTGISFKIKSQKSMRTNENELVLSLELNGMEYEGILYPVSISSEENRCSSIEFSQTSSIKSTDTSQNNWNTLNEIKKPTDNDNF